LYPACARCALDAALASEIFLFLCLLIPLAIRSRRSGRREGIRITGHTRKADNLKIDDAKCDEPYRALAKINSYLELVRQTLLQLA